MYVSCHINNWQQMWMHRVTALFAIDYKLMEFVEWQRHSIKNIENWWQYNFFYVLRIIQMQYKCRFFWKRCDTRLLGQKYVTKPRNAVRIRALSMNEIADVEVFTTLCTTNIMKLSIYKSMRCHILGETFSNHMFIKNSNVAKNMHQSLRPYI